MWWDKIRRAEARADKCGGKSVRRKSLVAVYTWMINSPIVDGALVLEIITSPNDDLVASMVNVFLSTSIHLGSSRDIIVFPVNL